MNQVLRLLAGAAVSLVGALLAVWGSIPLPWMLGPLILVAAVRMAGGPVQSATWLRNIGQWAIGVSLLAAV